MNDLIKSIIKDKKPCFFISPHLDDAGLSCGGLIRYLSDKTDVTVVNVFTKADTGKSTLSARKSLKDSGFSDALEYYKARVTEDAKAYSGLPISLVSLGEIDALWRKRGHNSWLIQQVSKFIPEAGHMYPTYRLHIARGVVTDEDTLLMKRIEAKLHKIIPKNACIFAPLGIGNHVDHLVVKYAVERAYKPIYWTDQPYFIHEKVMSKEENKHMKLVEFEADQAKKKAFLSHYKTQMDLLFPHAEIPVIREFFLVPR